MAWTWSVTHSCIIESPGFPQRTNWLELINVLDCVKHVACIITETIISAVISSIWTCSKLFSSCYIPYWLCSSVLTVCLLVFVFACVTVHTLCTFSASYLSASLVPSDLAFCIRYFIHLSQCAICVTSIQWETVMRFIKCGFVFFLAWLW